MKSVEERLKEIEDRLAALERPADPISIVEYRPLTPEEKAAWNTQWPLSTLDVLEAIREAQSDAPTIAKGGVQ